MAVHNTPSKVGTIQIGANLSSTTALIAATTNRTYSLKSVTISNTAAATITLEDSSGTDVMTFILPALGGVARDWDPGEVTFPISKGVNILSSTTDAVSAIVVCWYKDA